MSERTCTFEDCGRPHQSRGYCASHARMDRRGEPLRPIGEYVWQGSNTCAGPKCDKPVRSKGLCPAHYTQQANGQELTPVRQFQPRGGPCSVEACDREAEVEGMCRTHRVRYLRGDPDWNAPVKPKAPNGTGWVDDKGYRYVTVDGRQVREHRWLAEQILGRSLRKTEEVHHVDTNPSNNTTRGPFVMDSRGRLRSGNLEVWAHSHPRGGEIGPRLAWAVEELETFADVVPARTLARLTALLDRLQTTQETA